MRIISVLLLLSLSVSLLASEPETNTKNSSLSICGRILDNNTGESLAGVTVYLNGSDKKTFTDFDGNFVFNDITSGEHTIITEYVSYKKRIVRNIIPGNGSQIIKLQIDSVTITQKADQTNSSS